MNNPMEMKNIETRFPEWTDDICKAQIEMIKNNSSIVFDLVDNLHLALMNLREYLQDSGQYCDWNQIALTALYILINRDTIFNDPMLAQMLDDIIDSGKKAIDLNILYKDTKQQIKSFITENDKKNKENQNEILFYSNQQ